MDFSWMVGVVDVELDSFLRGLRRWCYCGGFVVLYVKGGGGGVEDEKGVRKAVFLFDAGGR